MDAHKITVCGGGNGAQALVPIAAHNLGCSVDVYAPFADEAERLRAGAMAHDGIEVAGAVRGRALPRRVSADPAEVIPGSDVVVLVLPAFAHESTLRQIVPFMEQGAWVGAMPARGGLDYCAARVLAEYDRNDLTLFGLQTLPWACRIRKYGRLVHVLGVKRTVDVAARPAAKAGEVTSFLERMLCLSTGTAASMLALTLANTGQLIHPGIMYALFADWDGETFDADHVPLFYHGLSQEGAQTLAGLSNDVQAIRHGLELALGNRLNSAADFLEKGSACGCADGFCAVRPLKAWLLRSYGEAIADPSTLHSALVTNRVYAGLRAPVREVGPGQFVPDFGARYLAEDVPFGLAVSRAIARLVGARTPTMDEVIIWAGAQLGKDYLGADAGEARIPQEYGLESLEALVAFST